MDKLKFVKLIVFFLTFLLILGIIVAGTTIYKKAAKPSSSVLNAGQTVALNLNQPAGSTIADFRLKGDRLFVLVKGGNLSDRIVVIDQPSSAIITTINTVKEKYHG